MQTDSQHDSITEPTTISSPKQGQHIILAAMDNSTTRFAYNYIQLSPSRHSRPVSVSPADSKIQITYECPQLVGTWENRLSESVPAMARLTQLETRKRRKVLRHHRGSKGTNHSFENTIISISILSLSFLSVHTPGADMSGTEKQGKARPWIQPATASREASPSHPHTQPCLGHLFKATSASFHPISDKSLPIILV